MSEKKNLLNDEQTEQVTGGLFVFNKSARTVTFTHPDGTVTEHKVLDFDKAFENCHRLEGLLWDAEKIFDYLASRNYIGY